MKNILLLIAIHISIFNIKAQCWDTIHIETSELSDFVELHFPVAAFSNGIAYYYDLSNSKFYESIDYGITWKFKSRIRNYNCSCGENNMKFVNPNRGWAMYNDTMYRTDNGGKNWFFIHDFYYPDQFPKSASKLYFNNENIGWFNNSDYFWTTKDGGITWNEIKDHNPYHVGGTPSNNRVFHDNIPIDKNMTIDSGKTWIKATNEVIRINDVRFTDEKYGYYLVKDTFNSATQLYSGGGIAYTSDGGMSWRKEEKGIFEKYQPPNYPNYIFFNIRYADSLNGFMYFLTNINFQYKIFRTKDRGKTWREDKKPFIAYSQESNWEWKMAYPSKDFGLISAKKGTLLRYKTPPPPDCNLVVVVDSLEKDKPINWYPPAGCIGGYVLKIGTILNGGDIVDSLDVGDTLQWVPTKSIPFGKDIFISVRPYNDGGFAPKCNSVLLPTKSCSLTTRIDTMINSGASIEGIVYTMDTILTKTYKSQQGCDSIVYIYVDVLTSNKELSFEFIQPISVSPNPTIGNLQVSFQLKKASFGNLYITDNHGRTLWKSENYDWNTSPQLFNLDVSKYPSGVYQLHWQSKNSKNVVSWVKID